MALLHTEDLDFAPEPKLKGLELVSIPNIDLAADLFVFHSLGLQALDATWSPAHAAAPNTAQLPSSLQLSTRCWQGQHSPGS